MLLGITSYGFGNKPIGRIIIEIQSINSSFVLWLFISY